MAANSAAQSVTEIGSPYLRNRECNIGGNFLLIYTLEEKKNLIVFVTTGTHAELFE